VVALSLLGVLMLGSDPAASSVPVQFRGMSLEQALSALESQGLAIVYSNALVKPWMRIRTEPRAGELEQMLADILAPFGLRVRRASESLFAVVRAEPAAPVLPAPGVTQVPGSFIANDERLEQVVVTASQYELSRSTGPSLQSWSGTDIENLPDIGDDALRAVARLPGTAANGISATVRVRGGEPNESLVRFDGLRLYNPFHMKDFQSIFSAIDPRIVSAVDVYTAGFAARFGDRMSSVLDITSLTPPAPLYHEVNASFFNTSLLSAGRFASDRGEWLASARRSNLDVWYHALSHEPGTPRYEDGFAKVSYRPSDRLRVTASVLYFADEISLATDDVEERASAEYADRYFWLRVDQRPTDFLEGTTLLAHTNLRIGRAGVLAKEGVAFGSLDDQRSFDIETLQSDWSWRGSERWLLQFGGELTRNRGTYHYEDHVEYDILFDTPGAPGDTERSRAIQAAPKQTREALYATLRFGVNLRLTSDVGIRWESHAMSPRLGARYQLTDSTAVRASWARMYQSQSIDELQVSDGLEHFFAPQRTDHTSLALEQRLPGGIQLRAELYDKRQRHLRPRFENLLNPLTLVPELNPDRIQLAPEHGHAHGLELLLSKSPGEALTWWLGYSRSIAKESLGGSEVLRSWDQTHAWSAGLNWSTVRWNVSAGFIQRSGWPTTAVMLEQGEEEPARVVTGRRNAGRTAMFRSVDARVARSFALDHSSLSVFLEVVNLLGRANPCCSAYEIDDETGGLELESRHAVPRIPSVGFLWQF